MITAQVKSKKMAPARVVALVALFVMAFLSLQPAGVLGQNNVDSLKQIYDAGDYQVVAKMAAEIVAAQPENALAHYYLASALHKIGKTTEARTEYTKCLTLGRGTAVAANAAVALGMTNQVGAGGYDGAMAQQVKLSRKHLLDQADAEKQRARRRFDEKVKEYQQEGRPQHGAAVDGVLKARTQAAFEELSREEAAITERYQKRADTLFTHQAASAEHGNGGSTTRTVPQGSNMYVQSYEHLEDESRAATIPTENPLTAKAYKLGESSASKTSKSKNNAGRSKAAGSK